MTAGVFETLLVIDGQPVEAEGHLERLRGATGMDATDFLQKSAAGLSGYHQLRIDYVPPESLAASATVLLTPDLFKGEFTRFALVTKQLKGRRLYSGHGRHKIADRQELETLEAETKPALPLLVDGSGNILETTRHNVFILEGDTLVTPPLDGRILPGVTRRVVLEEARRQGLACREEPVSLERAQASSGMFLTNALVGIGWAERCDGTSWTEIPPVVRTLHEALASRWCPSLGAV